MDVIRNICIYCIHPFVYPFSIHDHSVRLINTFESVTTDSMDGGQSDLYAKMNMMICYFSEMTNITIVEKVVVCGGFIKTKCAQLKRSNKNRICPQLYYYT